MELARDLVLFAVREFEAGIDPEGEWRLDVYRGALLKKNEDDQRVVAARLRLATFAGAMADMGNEELRRISKGNVPDEISEVLSSAGVEMKFLRHLARYLSESGEEGRDKVRLISHSANAAKEAFEDEDTPTPSSSWRLS